MIGALSGTVAALGDDVALIDVNGVGYMVHCGARTLSRLALGESVRFAVETIVREDLIRLYGFSSEEERGWFLHLQQAPGVGARVALNILDVLSPSELSQAVALEDKASIARANGVGPKLAARIAQELAGKPAPRGLQGRHGEPGAAPARIEPAANSARADAVSALLNLGIDQASAARAVAGAITALGGDASDPSVLIRAALKEVRGRGD